MSNQMLQNRGKETDVSDAGRSNPSYMRSVPSGPSIAQMSGMGGQTVVKVAPGTLDMEKYKMDHENRGHALIINNRKFHPSFEMPEREGSDVDASAIYQRLQELGFDCDLLNDATESQILKKLKEYASDEEFNRNADCFACCILTHGEEHDRLYATDKIMQLEDYVQPLFASHCKSLIQKPKLFFIQACRGNKLSSGQECIDYNEADSTADYSEYDAQQAEPKPQTFRVPDESDFLFVFSSFQGRQAIRNTHKGSPFAKALSDEILKLKDDVDIYTLLTRVNKSFLQYRPSNDMYQIPCFLSTLTKKLEIGPKD